VLRAYEEDSCLPSQTYPRAFLVLPAKRSKREVLWHVCTVLPIIRARYLSFDTVQARLSFCTSGMIAIIDWSDAVNQ